MNISFKPSVRPPTGAADQVVANLIVGGGPAGLAPLVAAGRGGMLDGILAGGLAIIEQSEAIGCGRIGHYAINSDSSAETIVSCVLDNPPLAELREHPATCAVAAYGRGAVPLRLIGAFLVEVGRVLRHRIESAAGGRVLTGSHAIDTSRTGDGLWRTRTRRASDGAIQAILSRQVVLATGAHQPAGRLESKCVGTVPLLPRFADKLIQSDTVLTAAGLDAIVRRLAAGHSGRVAIVGSSSSAMACAQALLRMDFGQGLAAGAVSVLHGRPLRVFYPSGEAALAEGYDEFGPDDICPVSGFVFRFAGFRLDSRELVMAGRGIGGRTSENRLRLHRVSQGPDPEALAILEDADVIVAALGYRPRALPVFNAGGQPVRLLADAPGERPLVDGQCQVLDAGGAPIAGLLGIGLAAGFASREAIGGEPSFSGQTNGLWQWQNEIGTIIAKRLLDSATRSRVPLGQRSARAVR